MEVQIADLGAQPAPELLLLPEDVHLAVITDGTEVLELLHHELLDGELVDDVLSHTLASTHLIDVEMNHHLVLVLQLADVSLSQDVQTLVCCLYVDVMELHPFVGAFQAGAQLYGNRELREYGGEGARDVF